MKILFCRTGWMNNYSGMNNDCLSGGGSYNEDNIGHEIYNFYNVNGTYFGYVQPVSQTIKIERIEDNAKREESIQDVLVVWVAKKPNQGGQFIVGWYHNATVYRYFQELADEQMGKRKSEFYWYNISTKRATLLSSSQRDKSVIGMGQSNVWYGSPEMNAEVISYIESIEAGRKKDIEKIEATEKLTGSEKEIVSKVRINQSYFRRIMLEKYTGKCCLCGVNNEDLLIASHIKPWSVSDENEKLNEFNGLLLCPNHDKLFDKGFISFDNNGNILISKKLDKTNRMFLNISEQMKIDVNVDNIEFIEYHRKNIFKK